MGIHQVEHARAGRGCSKTLGAELDHLRSLPPEGVDERHDLTSTLASPEEAHLGLGV